MNSDVFEATVILRQVEQLEKVVSATPSENFHDQQLADHWNSILDRTQILFRNGGGPLSSSIAHLHELYESDDAGVCASNYHYVRSALSLIKGSLLAFFDLKQNVDYKPAVVPDSKS